MTGCGKERREKMIRPGNMALVWPVSDEPPRTDSDVVKAESVLENIIAMMAVNKTSLLQKHSPLHKSVVSRKYHGKSRQYFIYQSLSKHLTLSP